MGKGTGVGGQRISECTHPPNTLRHHGLCTPSSGASSTVSGDSRSSRTIAATHSPSSPPYREVWSIARTSARMCLLGLPLVQPYPPPGLHQRRLHRSVRCLQPVSQGCILRIGQPVGSVSLQGSELPDQPREVAGCVPGYVLRVLWAHYEPLNMRGHQDRGSEGFRGLFPPPERVSLRAVSVGISRSAASRTGMRSGKLGRKLRSFSKAFLRRSESSVVCSRVCCICSRWSSICHSRLSM